MKKFIAILTSFAFVVCSLSGCRIEGYHDGYDKGYDDGYEAGCDYGYSKGIADAQRYIAFVVDDDLSSLARDIKKAYGLHPEDALLILSNYADVPDEVTEEELNKAIWALYRYYYDSTEVINSIEDYLIE